MVDTRNRPIWDLLSSDSIFILHFVVIAELVFLQGYKKTQPVAIFDMSEYADAVEDAETLPATVELPTETELAATEMAARKASLAAEMVAPAVKKFKLIK